MTSITKKKLIRPALIFALMLTLANVSLGSPSVAGAVAPYGPSYRYCGSFQTAYRVRVYETHLGCRKAMRIQREYWLGPKSRKTVVNGGVGARGYVLLKRFPGWRCGSGSGGGQCSKGLKSAAYQDGGTRLRDDRESKNMGKVGWGDCHVYQDDTPSPVSDVDEKGRCGHGARAFRCRYAV